MPTEAVDIIQNSSESIATLIGSILVGGAGTALWFRRKLSKDNLEIKRDDAAGDLIQHLEDERDHLKEEKDKILQRMLAIDSERQEAVSKVGQLSVEVSHLSRQVAHLEELVDKLSHDLRIASSTMHEFAIENAKLSEKLLTVKEIFDMKCDACIYKKKTDPCGIPADIQATYKNHMEK